MEGTHARGARSAAAAIKVATFTLVSFGAAAAASSAAYEGIEWVALEPPRPARRALATFPGQPTHSRRSLKFCPQAQWIVRARAS